MKICIVQISPQKGNVSANIDSHLAAIRSAVVLGIDVIIFPELSITGFEPALAKQLVQNPHSASFDCFEELAEEHEITIGIGIPTQSDTGLNISMLIFQPSKHRQVYSKTILHSDELPYFVCGDSEPVIQVRGQKLGIGICYETLQNERFLQSVNLGAKAFIASVAKPQNGIHKANSLFASFSKKCSIPILMANSIGYCDNFLSAGQSTVWNSKGKVIGQLNDVSSGLLIYDTETETVLKQSYLV
ncbi:carbon-nitrogen hydrolase family protein [Glaciecola sp. SC05]|uniref:carbon-nitrogen hydrolase family protein n=1 Tax=Glaciecola sp. SC05 TaxID=1987355 RepID=UPI003527D7BB